jgi:hypothetical protein
MVRFERGMHDLVLSAEPVRSQVLTEIQRWALAYLGEDRPVSTTHTLS